VSFLDAGGELLGAAAYFQSAGQFALAGEAAVDAGVHGGRHLRDMRAYLVGGAYGAFVGELQFGNRNAVAFAESKNIVRVAERIRQRRRGVGLRGGIAGANDEAAAHGIPGLLVQHRAGSVLQVEAQGVRMAVDAGGSVEHDVAVEVEAQAADPG
jgi:hypothetical protein